MSVAIIEMNKNLHTLSQKMTNLIVAKIGGISQHQTIVDGNGEET